MSNKRIKSFAAEDDYDDYDEDYYDDGEAAEQPEMTDGDREQLRLGTVKVREALGSQYSSVPAKDIEDALWNYYYDVGKSVAYLKNKHKPSTVTPRKAGPEKKGKLIVSYSWACCRCHSLLGSRYTIHERKDSDGLQELTHGLLPPPQMIPASFWDDTPWLNVPLQRQALIIEESQRPRGRLLGGASKDGKMSKLQALAAKRRQLAAEKASTASNEQPAGNDDYARSLEKLRISQARKAEKQAEEAAKIENADVVMQDPEQASSSQQDAQKQKDPEDEAVMRQNLRASPSTFASILTTTGEPRDDPLLPVSTESHQTTEAFDFTEPSPDSLISKAQSRLRD